jgi:CheY-like chemotaxis protein
LVRFSHTIVDPLLPNVFPGSITVTGSTGYEVARTPTCEGDRRRSRVDKKAHGRRSGRSLKHKVVPVITPQEASGGATAAVLDVLPMSPDAESLVDSRPSSFTRAVVRLVTVPGRVGDPQPSTRDTTVAPAVPAPVYYIVDDERVNLRVASRFMKTCGIPYETFEDGADLPKPLPSNVKAILLDIVMKRSDGVQVCRALRSGGCRVPIIAMTGNVTRGSIEQYKASGFNGVLSKPFTVEDVRQMGQYCEKWYEPTGGEVDHGWFTNLS